MPRPTIFLRKACRSSPSRLLRLPPRQSGRARWRALRSRGGRFPRLALRRYAAPAPAEDQAARPPAATGWKSPRRAEKVGDARPPFRPSPRLLSCGWAGRRAGVARDGYPRRSAAGEKTKRATGRAKTSSNRPQNSPETSEDLRLGSEPGRHRVLRLVLRLQGAAVISPTARARAQLIRQDPGRRCRGRRPAKTRRISRRSAAGEKTRRAVRAAKTPSNRRQ